MIDRKMVLQNFINLSLEEAIELARKNGFKTRITKKDGRYFICTRDLVSSRLNFELESNIVVNAHFG